MYHLVWRGHCSNGVQTWLNLPWGWRMDHRMKVCCLTLYGYLSSGFWCCILYGYIRPWCIREPRVCGWRSVRLFPIYLWLLGIGILSHLPLNLYILVCLDPLSGACAIGVFQSMGKWPHSFVLAGLNLILLSCCCAPSLLLFCVLCMQGLILEVVCVAEMFPHGWPWDCGLSFILLWYYICVPVGRCMCFNFIGALLMILPMCNLGWCGVISGVVAF